MKGILGGTFDPPHNGHVALAEAARSQLPIVELEIWVEESPGHRGVFADLLTDGLHEDMPLLLPGREAPLGLAREHV